MPMTLGFSAKPQRELQHREAEDRVEQERQPGDHEQRAPVAELIAQLAQPDQADDGPAHAVHRLQLQTDRVASRNALRSLHFRPRPPHISSSANGWAGPLGLGLGSDLRIASARIRSARVVILMFVAAPSTTWTGCPAASTSWASSVMSLPSLAALGVRLGQPVAAEDLRRLGQPQALARHASPAPAACRRPA